VYCSKNVGLDEIGIGKARGYVREYYKNACYWLGMETSHNYLVSQRYKVIGGRAGSPFENDYKGRKEADATKGSSIGDAKAFGATNTWDCNIATNGEQCHC
jgi:hypothetical protein